MSKTKEDNYIWQTFTNSFWGLFFWFVFLMRWFISAVFCLSTCPQVAFEIHFAWAQFLSLKCPRGPVNLRRSAAFAFWITCFGETFDVLCVRNSKCIQGGFLEEDFIHKECSPHPRVLFVHFAGSHMIVVPNTDWLILVARDLKNS